MLSLARCSNLIKSSQILRLFGKNTNGSYNGNKCLKRVFSHGYFMTVNNITGCKFMRLQSVANFCSIAMESLKAITDDKISLTKREQNQSGDELSTNKLSKRARKRMMREKTADEKKQIRLEKKEKRSQLVDSKEEAIFRENILKETEYYFENGLRKVFPYYFSFTTFAKCRWLKRQVLEVLMEEFPTETPEQYRRDIESGKVTVNNQKISVDYCFKDNDLLKNVVHRHEMPVSDEPIEIIFESDELLVVNKPSSMPVHPCGRYRHNSLLFILQKELGFSNLKNINRLDRLTSGVIILCKSQEKAAKLMENMAGKEVEKEYLCRVEGEFPSGFIECHEPIAALSRKMGIFKAALGGKESSTTFQILSYNGTSSVVKCKPHTGRTHQIRIHLQYLGYPIVNDPLYNGPVWGPKKGKGGDFGKTEEQLIKDLMSYHDSNTFLLDGDGTINNDVPLSLSPKPKATEITTSNDSSNGSESINLESGGPDAKRIKLDGDTVSALAGCEGGANATLDSSSKIIIDPHCNLCKKMYKDPTPDELVMFLHAYCYRGPGWEYKASVPLWATDDWLKL